MSDTSKAADHEHVRSTSVLEPADFNMTSWRASSSTTDFSQLSVDNSFEGRTQVMLIIIRKHLVDILERERRPKTNEEVDYEHVWSSWFRDPTNTPLSFFEPWIIVLSAPSSSLPGQGWYFPRLSHSLCQSRDDSSLGFCIPSALFDH